jgi:hypothetical protein
MVVSQSRGMLTVPEKTAGGPGRWWKGDRLTLVLLVWVALLPMQFQIGLLGSADRFAPADLVILLVPMVALHRVTVVKGTWSLAHTLMLGLLPVSLIYTLLVTGHLTSYAVVNKTLGIFLLFLAYVAITNGLGTYDLAQRAIRVFVISTTIVNVLSIIALLLWWDQPVFNDLGNGLDRLSGMLVDPNAYGGLLVVALAFLIPGVRAGRRLLPPVFHYVAWISLPLGILLTQSRSAWLALGVMFIALAVNSPGIAARALFALLFVVLLVAIVAGADSRNSFLDRSDRPQTIDSRVQHMRDALDAYVEAPVFGTGLGSFYEEHGQIVHVTALWFLSDMGVVGLVVFLAFIGTLAVWSLRLANGRREGARGDLTLGLLLAHASMIGLSLGIEAMYQRHWWFVMALIAILYAREGLGAARQAAVPTSRYYRSAGGSGRSQA